MGANLGPEKACEAAAELSPQNMMCFQDSPCRIQKLSPHTSLRTRIYPYLGGQGDLVRMFITPITPISTSVIPFINLLTKSPDPPSSGSVIVEQMPRLQEPREARAWVE